MDYVNSLLSSILRANTTSVLNKLEEHRQRQSTVTFQSILLLLTKEFNSPTWTENIDKRNQIIKYSTNISKRYKLKTADKTDVDHCVLIILHYIVSVIHKYKITDSDSIWTEILDNPLTKTSSFYEFLYKNRIIIPDAICTPVFENRSRLSSENRPRRHQSRPQIPVDKMTLFLLGFTNGRGMGSRMGIKDYEKLFSILRQQESFHNNHKPERLIYLMRTPEQLSLFLSHFSDYDLNSVPSGTDFTVLDRIINMKPYFYPRLNDNNPLRRTQDGLQPRLVAQQEPNKYPNEITKYRTARLLNLFRSVILRGGQLSELTFDYNQGYGCPVHRFFLTTIGIYALIGLRLNDIYPCRSSWQCDANFVLHIINVSKAFHPDFQEFILHYLAKSYSIIHKKKFIEQQRSNEDTDTQKINDQLFQNLLTLKEWCRLKIKDIICSQKHIDQLDLSRSLTDYCSYGLLSSNYAVKCIDEVTKHKGNLGPLKEIRRTPQLYEGEIED
ncbi:unnamed protein product [Adineta steineri]|uniref:Uncharacterized protein n=1 Tax=Adineta steineri TaxID=433720 RepID=A0A818UMJ8_9BILA|nr:unnamed protein product [Adineta steineri]CAF3699201.1 unnamed protein product [Adineta steineri]